MARYTMTEHMRRVAIPPLRRAIEEMVGKASHDLDVAALAPGLSRWRTGLSTVARGASARPSSPGNRLWSSPPRAALVAPPGRETPAGGRMTTA